MLILSDAMSAMTIFELEKNWLYRMQKRQNSISFFIMPTKKILSVLLNSSILRKYLKDQSNIIYFIWQYVIYFKALITGVKIQDCFILICGVIMLNSCSFDMLE